MRSLGGSGLSAVIASPHRELVEGRGRGNPEPQTTQLDYFVAARLSATWEV